MDVIIMQSTTSILHSLKNKYPQFIFESNNYFAWSPIKNTIYYDRGSLDLPLFLLHELSHALLGHDKYDRDIQLITMESQAWDHTIKLAKDFEVSVSDEVIQSTLDSYRDWMHSRSTCPKCQATGVQSDTNQYICHACNHNWQVNEARTCRLKRYQVTDTKKRT